MPKRRQDEIRARCTVVTVRQLLALIRGEAPELAGPPERAEERDR